MQTQIAPTFSDCTSGGVTVAHGDSATFYQNSSEPFGSNCSSELRSCTDGSLSGSFTAASCSVDTAPVAGVAAGGFQSCALTANNGVQCWGNSDYGQLGNGSTVSMHVPTDVYGLASGVKTVGLGLLHSCALTTTGGIKCWGYNAYGALGNGTTDNRYAPTDVTGLTSGVSAIAVGTLHTCAIDSGGGVKCWGSNSYGQIGNDTTSDQLSPTSVTGLSSGIVAIAAGRFHTCAVKDDGGVKCWGYNGALALGPEFGASIIR